VRKIQQFLRLSGTVVPAFMMVWWTIGPGYARGYLPRVPNPITRQVYPVGFQGIFLPIEQPPDESSDTEQDASNGVNLVPLIRNFRIQTQVFLENSRDVQDGCVTPGEHRLLRFDLLMQNIGDQDLVIGPPAVRPDLFVFSAGHNHYHMIDFVEYRLLDIESEEVTENYKQAICFFDSMRIADWARGNRQFNPGRCNQEQGLSAGWADLYRASISCQYIVVDDVKDGSYSLMATANAQRIVGEVTHMDNTICKALRFVGNRVSETSSDTCRDWEILHTDPDERTPEEKDLCRLEVMACWE
jgi:hypothetical protein